MLVPKVITRTPYGERGMDLFSGLLAENIICISGLIDDDLANLVTAQILFLEGEDPDRDICLYINSPGGSVTAALAIYDTMQYVMPDISTICIGQAASTSAMLVAAGARGKRFALPNARLLITQPSLGEISGQATDIEIQAREILRLRALISKILAKHTSRSYEQIERDIERDLILNASQALDYGLIDVIQRSRADYEISSVKTPAALTAAELMA
ncbi:MAG: ATP-dependent Clp protease proteolytic subunit [Blastocatellia bacterium]|nr:ATP-dependent Clp protease proteolytic subunit [Blastocatellia bacterium]